MRFTDVHDDAEATLAARALDRALRQRSIERLRRFHELRTSYLRRWQEVTGASEFMLHVSPEELRALDEEITAILQRYRPRIADPQLRPADSLPIELLLFADLGGATAPVLVRRLGEASVQRVRVSTT